MRKPPSKWLTFLLRYGYLLNVDSPTYSPTFLLKFRFRWTTEFQRKDLGGWFFFAFSKKILKKVKDEFFSLCMLRHMNVSSEIHAFIFFYCKIRRYFWRNMHIKNYLLAKLISLFSNIFKSFPSNFTSFLFLFASPQPPHSLTLICTIAIPPSSFSLDPLIPNLFLPILAI